MIAVISKIEKLNACNIVRVGKLFSSRLKFIIHHLSFIIFLSSIFHLSSFISFSQPLKEEAKKAFEYLNEVRANPKKFSKEIGADLSKVKPLPPLVWNDTLAKIAEEKATDMAKRKYFAHVTPDGKGINIMIHEAGYKLPQEWIKQKKLNYFESLHAGTESGIEAIKELILDKNEPTKGHRQHLLGMNDFHKTSTDIGIGHVKAEKGIYSHYTVVIIAKQNW